MNQDLINQVKREIFSSHEETVEEYYGVQIEVYKDIDKYLSNIPDIYDKIHIAQFANNFAKARELIKSLELSSDVKAKYEHLLQNNSDLNETIDIRILMPKYNFLDDMLDMITTNSDVQEQILSLSDEKLELFKNLYKIISKKVGYKVPYVTEILNRIGTITPYTSWKNRFYKYSSLENAIAESMASGEIISKTALNNLLYLYTTNLVWDVNTIEELEHFSEKNGIFHTAIDEIIQSEQGKEEKDLNTVKNAVLLKTFGIDLKSAEALCKRYNIKGIQINNENTDLFEMYQAILEILLERNANLLIDAYNQFSKEMNVSPNFMRTITFENMMRKAFSQNLNANVYQCNNECTLNDGIKIFEAGTDFKMIVTAIGAYQGDFGSKDNYMEYWNSPTIRSHGNCCSLIGNNNLSMANPKNVIFGFSSMDDNMLLLSSSRDINSTPTSKEFNIAAEEGLGENHNIHGEKYFSPARIGMNIEFSSPDRLLDNTRGDYNELVYERRDLGSNPLFYKKNPDYIVFIEEYEDINAYFTKYKDDPKMLTYLREQKRLQDYQYEQSLKAAKDFNIPIVKINREQCAKQAINEIEKTTLDFEHTLNPNDIEKVICQFENNRVGNHDKHLIIRDTYFSINCMNLLLNRIESAILKLDDKEEKDRLLKVYYRAIKNEQNKVKNCNRYRNNGQLSAIDFESTLTRINNMSIEAINDEQQI